MTADCPLVVLLGCGIPTSRATRGGCSDATLVPILLYTFLTVCEGSLKPVEATAHHFQYNLTSFVLLPAAQ